MSTCNSNIVVEWLRSLQLGQYADSFLDNGYDDLEICKQVGDPDLDAIGVFNPGHRQLLLQSVRSLREEGAASVYFTLEETAAAAASAGLPNLQQGIVETTNRPSSRPSSRRGGPDKETAAGAQSAASLAHTNDSPVSSSASAAELGKYLDEYEEGKAELIRIPKLQLKLLLKEKLLIDGIRLICQPYSNAGGERGYLEGLASQYADRFNTHYQDVLEHLEELRRREWEELSPRMRVLQLSAASTPGTPPACSFPGTPLQLLPPTPGSLMHQPIYAPGKYSPRVLPQPSSCLSDKEEDEIYGFGYGVYGKQMCKWQQQQQRALVQAAAAAAAASGPHHTAPAAVPIYQSCLSPRSACFYEFPPNLEQQAGTSKKKTRTFSRLLRGFKSHRKDKSSPTAQQRAACGSSSASRVGTPEGLCEEVTDISEYDRLRFLQINGGAAAATSSIEETIQWLKVQEALKKKERFQKEQDEILRDIRHGMLQIGLDSAGPSQNHCAAGGTAADDTYMYDDEVRVSGPPPPPQHWYDEPPYESDPEDFLMAGLQQPVNRAETTAAFHNGRVYFTLKMRPESQGEGVISLRSAGDISLPRDANWRGSGRAAGNPRAASRHTRHRQQQRQQRESGDYAASDAHSVSSRLSAASLETNRSEHEGVAGAAVSPVRARNPPAVAARPRALRSKPTHKGRGGSRAVDGAGSTPCSPSSEEEDSQPRLPVKEDCGSVSEGGSGSLLGRMRGLRQDVQRKVSRLRSHQGSQGSQGEARGGSGPASPSYHAASPASKSHSSAESLPSGSGSSTQALMPASSSLSPVSPEARDALTALPILSRARALVDYVPSPYDHDALRFKKGDVIEVVAMNASGLWQGRLHNQLGLFKFINVELLAQEERSERFQLRGSSRKRGKPNSVEELLQRINMESHISVLVLNGYEDLELFKELEEEDLDFLGISQPEHRAKLLAAVKLLHDYDSPDSPCSGEADCEDEHSTDGSAGKSSERHRGGYKPFQRQHFPRDSGCYTSEGRPELGSPRHPAAPPRGDPPTSPQHEPSNNLEASPASSPCSNPATGRRECAFSAFASVLATASLAAAQSRNHELPEDFRPNIPVTDMHITPDPTAAAAVAAAASSLSSVPRGQNIYCRNEYDKLRGKLEASLLRGGTPPKPHKPEGGEGCGARQPDTPGTREKSSDSGVSSSSRSPPLPAAAATTVTTSPTRLFAAYSCGLDRKPTSPGLVTNAEKDIFH